MNNTLNNNYDDFSAHTLYHDYENEFGSVNLTTDDVEYDNKPGEDN